MEKMGRRNIGALTSTKNVPPDDAKRALDFSMKLAKLCPNRVQSPEELADRFEKLFEIAFNDGVLPRYEHLVLVSGLPKRTFFDYGNEDNTSAPSQIYSPVIKRAKNMISAAEATLASTGKIPAPVYIFRAKNYEGLKDVQEIQTTNTYNTDPRTPEEVVQALPEVDENNFIEIKGE